MWVPCLLKIAHHLGFTGYVTSDIRYRNFFTFSRNFVTYSLPFVERRDQFSWMLEFSRYLKMFDLEAGMTLSIDAGEMYGNNMGILFTIRKTGIQ